MSESERVHALRLTPDRALGSPDEAAEWIEERGLVTLMPCCSLPSLFAACHEEPYAPGKRGLGQWPRTKYWWPFALTQRPGIHGLKVHRGKTLLVSDAVARLIDPLARAALAEAEQGPRARLLAHLADAGPSLVADLEVEVASVKRARAQLERTGALVARTVEVSRALSDGAPALGPGSLRAGDRRDRPARARRGRGGGDGAGARGRAVVLLAGG